MTTAHEILRSLRWKRAATKAHRERAEALRIAGVERHALFDDAGRSQGYQYVMTGGRPPTLPDGWSRRLYPLQSLPLP